MRFSKALLLIHLLLTREQKSSKDLNRPSFSRISTIVFKAFSPTFFTAAKPKRILFLSTVNVSRLAFISGGKISIPICLHCSIYSPILLLVIKLVKIAAINSCG